jgi:hypothetical protein
MKLWIFSLLGVSVIIAAIATREWLLLKEIHLIKNELSVALKANIESAESFGRLEQMRQSSFVYDRFLEPVFLNTQRMLWPPSRSKANSQWEKHVHSILDRETYQRTLNLRDDLKAQIKPLEAEIFSYERLKKTLEMALKFDSESLRLELLQKETQDLESFLANQDNQLFQNVRDSGRTGFQKIRSKLVRLNDSDFRDFISSSEFLDNLHGSVVSSIMAVNSPELRQRIWTEYLKSLKNVLQQRPKRLASHFENREAPKRPGIISLQESFQNLSELIDSNEELSKTPPVSMN